MKKSLTLTILLATLSFGNSVQITNFYTFVIFIISFIALLKTKINSAFFILAGGVIGYFLF